MIPPAKRWQRKHERIARHPGSCSICHDPIKVGSRIAWAPNTEADHIDCYADLFSTGGGRLEQPKPTPVIRETVVVNTPVAEVHDLITREVYHEPIERPHARLNPRRRKAAYARKEAERQRTASLRNAGPVRTSHVADSVALGEKLSSS